MHKAQINRIPGRSRTGSISDMHIHYCGCSHCDGMGELTDPFSSAGAECPACEGMGYLDPASREAYEVYLNDLYREVVRPMPRRRDDRHEPTRRRFYPAA